MLQKILFLGLVLAFACKNSKQAASETMDITQTITQQLGDSYEVQEQGTLVLCYTNDEKNGTDWRTILVIDKTSGDLLFGPEKLNAKVSWHSERKLLIQESPEVIQNKQSADDFSYIYNLDTKQKENTTP